MGNHVVLKGRIGALLEVSENYRLSGPQRTRYRFLMIEECCRSGHTEDWLVTGEALVRACDIDDLTPQVSDRFIEHCPVEVFRQVMDGSPSQRFCSWNRRRKSLTYQN